MEKMLLWVQHTGEPLYARSKEEEDYGTQIRIESDEIDPYEMMITVSLRPNMPTDELRRTNTGSLQMQMGISRESVFEQVGYEDPQGEMKKRFEEDEFEHEVALRREEEKMRMQTGVQMEAQQAMQEGQMAREQQMQGEAMAAQERDMMGPMPGGQGFNSAMQGTPAVEVAPPEVALRDEEEVI